MNYKERLILPLEGFDDIIFYTKSNLVICKGYNRIVIGDRGPYIEFKESNILKDNIHIPQNQKWRLNNNIVFFIEYRSNCKEFVKIYKQKRIVDYADYKEGYWYISPFDLISDKFEILIENNK